MPVSDAYSVNEQQRCPTTIIENHGVDTETPGRRNAWGYNVLSLTSTINIVDDCWHSLPVRYKLLIIFIFQQIGGKMLPIRDENAHQTLFSLFDRKRRSQTTISLNASTWCEHVEVQDENDGCKPKFLSIDFRLLGRLLGNAGGLRC